MSKFVKLKYRINWGAASREVSGYAFETPGWPEFHACVRFGRREDWDPARRWIVDHYESGLALRGVGPISRKQDAPEKLAAFLLTKGSAVVAEALRKFA